MAVIATPASICAERDLLRQDLEFLTSDLGANWLYLSFPVPESETFHLFHFTLLQKKYPKQCFSGVGNGGGTWQCSAPELVERWDFYSNSCFKP